MNSCYDLKETVCLGSTSRPKEFAFLLFFILYTYRCLTNCVINVTLSEIKHLIKRKKLSHHITQFLSALFCKKCCETDYNRGTRTKAIFKTYEDGSVETKINLYSSLLCCSLKPQHMGNVIYYFLYIYTTVFLENTV